MLVSKASSPGPPGPKERKSGQVRFVTTCVWYIYILHRAAIHLSRSAHTFDFQPGKSGIGEVSSSGRNLPSKTAKQFTINTDPSDSHRIESHVNCKYKKRNSTRISLRSLPRCKNMGSEKVNVGWGGGRKAKGGKWGVGGGRNPCIAHRFYTSMYWFLQTLALFSSPALLLLFCTVVDRLRAHFFV